MIKINKIIRIISSDRKSKTILNIDYNFVYSKETHSAKYKFYFTRHNAKVYFLIINVFFEDSACRRGYAMVYINDIKVPELLYIVDVSKNGILHFDMLDTAKHKFIFSIEVE